MGEPVEVLASSDTEIDRLFPKCGPRNVTNRNDLNSNYVSDDNDNYDAPPFRITTIEEEVASLESSASSISRMSVDSATPLSTPASHSSNGGTVDREGDLSVVSAYVGNDRFSAVLDSSYEEIPGSPTSNPLLSNKKEHFCLRDSRIEAAGGRELFSQSRSRSSRRRPDETRRVHYHFHHNNYSQSQQLNLPSAQQQKTTHQQQSVDRRDSSCSQSSDTASTSSSGGRSNESRDPVEVQHTHKEIKTASSAFVYETCLSGSAEIVFDDISDWVVRGLTVRGFDNEESKEYRALKSFIPIPITSPTPPSRSRSPSHTDQESDFPEDTQSPIKVTKIGNVPIAKYEGSPRRYGQSQRPARPGFPKRIMDVDERSADSSDDKNKSLNWQSADIHRPQIHSSNNISKSQPLLDVPDLKFFLDIPDSNEEIDTPKTFVNCTAVEGSMPSSTISTLNTTYASKLNSSDNQSMDSTTLPEIYESYGFEDSETRKVLEEFFFDSGKKTKQEFFDLEYTLKRQHGNSYVGQRLAECEEDIKDDELNLEQQSFIIDHSQIKDYLSDSSLRPQLSYDDETAIESIVENGELSEVSQFTNLNYGHHDCETSLNHLHFYEHSLNSVILRDDSFAQLSLDSDASSPLIVDENTTDPTLAKLNNNKSEINVKSVELEIFFDEKSASSSIASNNDQEISVSAQDIERESTLHPFLISTGLDFDNVLMNEELKDNHRLSLSDNHETITDAEDQEDESHENIQLGISRNFTLSPETTSCDSLEVESEYSIGEAEGSLHSSGKIVSTMPVLEDGLSSGEESDIEVVSTLRTRYLAEKDKVVLYTQRMMLERHNQIMHQESNPQPVDGHHRLIETQDQFENEEINDCDIDDSTENSTHKVRSSDNQLCRGELPEMVIINRLKPMELSSDENYVRTLSPSMDCSHVSPLSQINQIPNCHQSPSSSTLILMKKQITEIELEIALKKPDGSLKSIEQEEDISSPALELELLDPLNEKMAEPPPPPAPHPHRNGNNILKNCSSTVSPNLARSKSVSPSDITGHLHSPQFSPVSEPISGPQLLSSMGSLTSPLQITPHMVSGHPAMHDLQHKQGTSISPSRESVEAAIADIKQAIRLTKNLPLKTHSQDRHDKGPIWVPRDNRRNQPPQPYLQNSCPTSPQQQHICDQRSLSPIEKSLNQKQKSSPSGASTRSRDRSIHEEEDGDTDQETDRLLGQQRSDDPGFLEEKSWKLLKSRPAIPQEDFEGSEVLNNESSHSSPARGTSNQSPTSPMQIVPNKIKNKKDKEMIKKKGRSKEVLIEGVLFRARYLGSTQLVSEGQPTKTTRMMQAEEAVSRIKALAPEGEAQPSTEVDLFISTEKIMVLNTDLKEIMMDHALRTISYIADIGDLVVLMARRRVLPTDDQTGTSTHRIPKMICHVFESDEAQFIAQSIGQAFQVAYLEFLKANGIEDHSFVKEMDYQEVLNSQEIFGDELQMFAKKELQKEVVVPKMKGEILGLVVVESGWGSMVPTVVIANLSPTGAAAKCGQLNIGDQIIAINGVSLVGLPLSNCQNYIKNTKYNTAVKLTVVPCPPVVEVKIRRPDTKYQLGFSVQNGVICSLLRGGIAERGGVRVGHRIIDINNQSVVAVPHEKIVNLLATSVGEIRMKTMPTSIFRLLTGQESPQFI